MRLECDLVFSQIIYLQLTVRTNKVDSNLDDHRPGLKPPRFSLAMLFVAVGLCGVLFATTSYLGFYAMLLLVLFMLTVAAHVAGNAIGTQLRENGSRPPAANDGIPQPPRRPIAVSSTDFAPASQLHHRSALGKPIFITTATGCVLGAMLGGYGLTMLMERPTLQAIALGAVASAVLGGIWTFAASSFLQVASSALRQATRDARR
ncbi:MAG TPA: hypothetical protein VMM76_20360 [Pirellulaceae bacterium]|nr:hypothetical protein [Pirellulaceae bacterium]